MKDKPVDIEIVTRNQINLLKNYKEIECPDETVGHTPDSHNICFAGNAEAEDFIREFTEKMAPYLKNDVYWRRDYGIWHAQMDFKDSENSVVARVMMKGDADTLQSNPDMKNYSVFIACAIFDQ